jgi:hypothetical protein
MGIMQSVTPSTNNIFVLFEPIAFPIARPALPCHADKADTKSSGAEVPKPSITMPIRIFEILKCCPNSNALSAKVFALHIRNKNPNPRAAI